MKSKLLILLFLVLFLGGEIKSQTFLNGSFEKTSVTDDVINLSHSDFNIKMDDCYSFGSWGDLDIIKSSLYCGSGAQDGIWYLALTGGGTDALSIKLNTPLNSGQSYSISYYDRFCDPYGSYNSHPFQIGLSTTNNVFGQIIFTDILPPDSNWKQKKFSFTAPNNGQYITVVVNGGSLYDTWVQLDNFKFESATGLSERDVSKKPFSVYPNPAIDKIEIESFQYSRIEILNLYGELKKTIVADGMKSNIDISDLSSGIYFVKVRSEKEFAVMKFMKK
jgi:hypothetical protein